VIATETLETTGAPTQLRASIKDGVGGGAGIVAGCSDVALVQVEVLDAAGRVVAGALDVNITFTIDGVGAVYVGGGNGDPSCHVSDLSATRPAYHGVVLGIVRAEYNASTYQPKVKVRVSAPGLRASNVDINVISPPTGRMDASKVPWWCKGGPQI
jgi:beta-galactosidase